VMTGVDKFRALDFVVISLFTVTPKILKARVPEVGLRLCDDLRRQSKSFGFSRLILKLLV